ncbi:hypothetical protein [Actinomadura terrae]|uniref:hypothetical protein n=1 Tax=Actinomadura terrae TaxID=604353 RepID=UPI001FA79F7D|nr:hypothetical protein [Actinomadura terrae]
MSVADQSTDLTESATGAHDLGTFLARLPADGVSLRVDARLTSISRNRPSVSERLRSSGKSVGIGRSAEELQGARRRFSTELEAPAAHEWLAKIACWTADHLLRS